MLNFQIFKICELNLVELEHINKLLLGPSTPNINPSYQAQMMVNTHTCTFKVPVTVICRTEHSIISTKTLVGKNLISKGLLESYAELWLSD